ncbi:MAG TPA: hypothetical protein VFY84_19310 [Jiangellales bacterium]|nr:hypothetical protein [Jiangellales bacterium]
MDTVETEEGTEARGGYGRLPAYMSLQMEEAWYEVVRLMAHASRRSAGDIVREALYGAGLRSVAGYADALEAYERGERAPKRATAQRKRGQRGGAKNGGRPNAPRTRG